jgi:drug/metabolite transporter (DMT)-like permease
VPGKRRALERVGVLLDERDESPAHPRLALIARGVRAQIGDEPVDRRAACLVLDHRGMLALADREPSVMRSLPRRSPLMVGAGYALLAAVAFGATTPLVARYAATLGPWTIAALLYAGAALVAALTRRAPWHERGVTFAELRRIGAAGVIGGMLAPAALAWGLHRTGALGASLTLSLESVFTIVLAAAIFHEHVSPRIAGAALLIGMPSGTTGALGIAAIALATLLWAIDNTITGTLAYADPATVVFAKSVVGACCAAVAVVVSGETPPGVDASLALLAIGAVGYGASLRWYLFAQRTFGVARTASVFAGAPFIGAVLAYVLGDRIAGTVLVAGAVAIAAGIALHITERHAHRHRHRPLDHEHAHRHDDEHHAHPHAAGDVATHSHPHHHLPLVHEHSHGPDAHHAHEHETPGR